MATSVLDLDLPEMPLSDSGGDQRFAAAQDGYQRGLHCFSGRAAELKADGVIEEMDVPRREGCTVLRVK